MLDSIYFIPPLVSLLHWASRFVTHGLSGAYPDSERICTKGKKRRNKKHTWGAQLGSELAMLKA